MKKRNLIPVGLITGLGLLAFSFWQAPKLVAKSSTTDSKTITVVNEDDSQQVLTIDGNENETIAILKYKLADYTDEEIDAYFSHYESDDQRIVADEHGGLLSSGPGYEGDGDAGYVLHVDGRMEHYNINSPASTTVGEAKRALKETNNQ